MGSQGGAHVQSFGLPMAGYGQQRLRRFFAAVKFLL